MAAALRPLRLPGFPNLGARLPRQRARQLARRDRARDPRLRPDRQPDGDRGAVLRHALRPGRARPAARRAGRGAAGPGRACPALYAAEAVGVRRCWRCSSTTSRSPPCSPSRRRRLDRLRRPGADPRRGRPPCSRRPASCARATRCSTSPSRSAPPAARRSPASSSPAPGSRRRCSPTRSRSWRSPALLAVARRLALPEPEEPEARLGASACAAGSPTCASGPRCAACSAPRRSPSSSSRS